MAKQRCICPAPHDTKSKRCYRIALGTSDYCVDCRRRGFEYMVRLTPGTFLYDWPKWDRNTARHIK